jgi:sugar phosphate permease
MDSLQAEPNKASKVRYSVLFWLCLLYLISYLDRVAISVTAPQMMKELSFTKTQMGLIFAAFAYPYTLVFGHQNDAAGGFGNVFVAKRTASK